MSTDFAFDQLPGGAGWRRVGPGLWRNTLTGETWRSWAQYGRAAGHFPAADWARRAARQARAAETQFARQLRQIGRQVSELVRGVLDPNNPADPGWDAIDELLRQYRELLKPWASQTATRMLADVSRRDAAGWHQLGREIGQALGQEISTAPIQDTMTDLYNYQVEQILKLPEDAAERIRESRTFSAEIVQQMRGPAEEAMVGGRRWEDLMTKVRDEGLHVQSSAETVARTETARAASTLQAARAKYIGSELFIWKTAGDRTVRDLHDEISKRNVGYGRGIYRWDDPPELDDGRPGLPGTIWNCRCFAMPVLPAVGKEGAVGFGPWQEL